MTDIDPTTSFFEAVAAWHHWCEKNMASELSMLAICLAKPPGLRLDYNLYMDSDGQIWRSYGSDELQRLERSSTQPFAPYKTVEMVYVDPDDLGEKLNSFPKRSSDFKNEDWGWSTSPDPRSTLNHVELGLTYAARGIACAEAILNQREAITDWLRSYAVKVDRTSDTAWYNDWEQLVAKFVPAVLKNRSNKFDLPDRGSVLCELHAVLDELGGHKDIHSYAH